MEDLNVETCEEVIHCIADPSAGGNEHAQNPKRAKDQED
jgi:hypothetical protein